MSSLPVTPPARRLVVPSRTSDQLAAIDLGSNSFRLEVAHVLRGQYQRIDYLKETVRLGAGLDEHSMLTEEAAQRGLACLSRFAQRLTGFQPHQVRAVATQTLREARNRDAFLARAQAVLGFPIEVISGREEARLIYSGVARLQPSRQPRLVIDIGGRSTEMIIGRGLHAQLAESFQVGSVGLSMKYFPQGRFTAKAFRQAQIEAGAELEEALGVFGRGRWREALGSSGTVGAVGQMLAAAGETDGSVTPAALRWCIQECLRAGHQDALALPGLKPERRAVIGGGLCILYTLAMQFGIDVLRPAKGALRQGVIFDLAQRLEAQAGGRLEDLRDRTVRELQRSFGVDAAQAQRVRRMALSLFAQLDQDADGTAGAPNGPETTETHRAAQRELGWVAALHEIGMMVSHHDHHRHSAYLIGHMDAAGFSQSQLRRLSQLALGQRGALRKLGAALNDAQFQRQLLCLRLAVILCHARMPLSTDAARLRRLGDRWVLGLEGTPDTLYRTLYLLEEEARVWREEARMPLQIKVGGLVDAQDRGTTA